MTDSPLAKALAAFQAEEWRPVLNGPGYEVSDLGRVRSLDRTTTRGGYPMRIRGRVLAASLADPRGHLKVQINRRTRLVHALVLEAFVGPRPAGMESCHNNGNPADNRCANLRWDTRTANIYDAVRHGTHTTASRTHCPRGHELCEPNLTRSMLPYRQCLACNRARARVSWLRSKGREGDLVAIAADYYDRILEGVA